MYSQRDRQGSILIVGLWILLFLGGLAVAVGVQVATCMELARHVDGRLRGRCLVQTAVGKAVGILDSDTNEWDGFSERWADSPSDFSNAVPNGGWYALVAERDSSEGAPASAFGMNDETARIDINTAPVSLLTALLQTACGLAPDPAAALAGEIEKSRAPEDETGQGGRASGNPRDRHGPFQSVHELLLVKGMKPELFRPLEKIVTVGGGPRVNANTAGKAVLKSVAAAVGGTDADGRVSDELVRKVLKFRESGGMFTTYGGLRSAEVLNQAGRLSGEEMALFRKMTVYLGVSSDRFRGVAIGGVTGKGTIFRRAEFVWDRRQRKVLFWHED